MNGKKFDLNELAHAIIIGFCYGVVVLFMLFILVCIGSYVTYSTLKPMTIKTIISRADYVRDFPGRDGKTKSVYEIEFSQPCASKEGKVYYDKFIGSYYCDRTTPTSLMQSLVGREVQIVAYFNVDAVNKNNETRYYQRCYIRDIYTNDNGTQQ